MCFTDYKIADKLICMMNECFPGCDNDMSDSKGTRNDPVFVEMQENAHSLLESG